MSRNLPLGAYVSLGDLHYVVISTKRRGVKQQFFAREAARLYDRVFKSDAANWRLNKDHAPALAATGGMRTYKSGWTDYEYVAIKENGKRPVIHAGCRRWRSFDHAVGHYRRSYPHNHIKIAASMDVLGRLAVACRRAGIRGLGRFRPIK